MNDLITNGEAKNDEPYMPPLDRIEDKLSYFIGKLVQHHVQKAVEANVESVARLGRIIDAWKEKTEGELDELKANQVSVNQWDFEMHDNVNDLINERLDERDAERNVAEDSSEYVRVEDLADGIRDCILNGEVTLNVEVS